MFLLVLFDKDLTILNLCKVVFEEIKTTNAKNFFNKERAGMNETDAFDLEKEKEDIHNALFCDSTVFDEVNETQDFTNFASEIDQMLDDEMCSDMSIPVPTNAALNDNGIFGNSENILDLDTFLQEEIRGNAAVLFPDANILSNIRDDCANIQKDLREIHIDIPEIDVSNVVCKSFVGCKINLPHCNQFLKNSSMHTHNKFPALFIRLKNPRLSILLFSTGKVVITGARLYEDACLAVQRLVGSLVKLNYAASVGEVKIENFVAKVCMGFPVKLSELQSCTLHKRYCDQQNGRFPCINYRIYVIEPKVTIRVFGNGIFLIQSAKSMTTLRKAVELMVPVLHQFRNRTDIPVEAEKLLPLFDRVNQHPRFIVDNTFIHPFSAKGSTKSNNGDEVSHLFLDDHFDVSSWIDLFGRRAEQYAKCLLDKEFMAKLLSSEETKVGEYTVEERKLNEKDTTTENADIKAEQLRMLVNVLKPYNVSEKRSVYVRLENACPFTRVYTDCVDLAKDVLDYLILTKESSVMLYLIQAEKNMDKHFLVSVENRMVKEIVPFNCHSHNDWLASLIERDWTCFVLVRLWYLTCANVVHFLPKEMQNFTVHFCFNHLDKVQLIQVVPRSFSPAEDRIASMLSSVDNQNNQVLLKFNCSQDGDVE
jgi:transcription initiation factor TFIID TATA-box-binding protein